MLEVTRCAGVVSGPGPQERAATSATSGGVQRKHSSRTLPGEGAGAKESNQDLQTLVSRRMEHFLGINQRESIEV